MGFKITENMRQSGALLTMNTAIAKQLIANRQNGLKGGVKTDAGKATSKYNAIRHGILVKVLKDEEVTQAKKIQERLMSECEPETTIEELLIETLTIAYIRGQRTYENERLWSMDASQGTNRYLTTTERQFYRALHELQRVQAIRKGLRPTSMAVDLTGMNDG